jgi:hypothetical protein
MFCSTVFVCTSSGCRVSEFLFIVSQPQKERYNRGPHVESHQLHGHKEEMTAAAATRAVLTEDIIFLEYDKISEVILGTQILDYLQGKTEIRKEAGRGTT